MPKKPGRPSKYDGRPLERLLQLLAGYPGVGVDPAALRVASELNAIDPKQYAEGLRKRYRVRRDRGDLPTTEQEERARSAEILEIAEALLRGRDAAVERSRRELAEVEEELRSMGVDPDMEDLPRFSRDLITRYKLLQSLDQSPPDMAARSLLTIGGLQTVAEVQAAIEQNARDLKRVSRLLRLLGDLRQHREFLGTVPEG